MKRFLTQYNLQVTHGTAGDRPEVTAKANPLRICKTLLQGRANKKLKIAGFVPTMCDTRTAQGTHKE